ncbi:MAG: hypothetical protein ACFFDT_27050, partial [Candidatus Hodarchaeota archaeon]
MVARTLYCPTYAWWLSGFMIMTLFSFEFGIHAFGLYSIYGPLTFFVSLPFLLSAFIGPLLEWLYYKYLAYSIWSLTAMVLISFMMSIAVVFHFQLFTVYFLTP